MPIERNQIQLLKSKTKIPDFNNVTNEQFSELQVMLSKNAFSKQELAQLIELIPNFIDLQKEFIGGVKEVARETGDIQRTAFNIIDKQMQILNVLANTAQSDDTRLKIAEHLIQLSKELNPILERMNSDNNDVWKKITAAVVATAGIALVIARIFGGSNK